MKLRAFWSIIFSFAVIALSCDKSVSPDNNDVPSNSVGSLLIKVTGLPAHLSASIVVTGPAGFSHQVSTGEQIDSLTPGIYTVTASQVVDTSGEGYVPTYTSQKIPVEENKNASIEIVYSSPNHGKLQVNVSGLPASLDAWIMVINDDASLTYVIYGTDLIDNLLPGDYTVTALEVTDLDGTVYIFERDIYHVFIERNLTKTLDVRFVPKYGKLQINVRGLPSDLDAYIHADYNSFGGLPSYVVFGPDLLDSLLPGVYTVHSHKVVDLGGDTLFADPDSVDVTVTAGQTTILEIEYIRGVSFQVYANLDDGSLRGSLAANYDNVSSRLDTSSYDPSSAWLLEANGCFLISPDITDFGIDESIRATLQDGSFEGSQTLVVSRRDRSFEYTDHRTVRADVPTSTYIGSLYGLTYSARGPILQIDNPNQDSIGIVVHWDVTGNTTYSGNDMSRSGASVHSWMRLYTSTCYTNLGQASTPVAFNAYSDHYHNSDNLPLTGETTIVIKNELTYLIWFDLQTQSRVDSFQEALSAGHDGEGSGAADMTIVISVTIEKY